MNKKNSLLILLILILSAVIILSSCDIIDSIFGNEPEEPPSNITDPPAEDDPEPDDPEDPSDPEEPSVPRLDFSSVSFPDKTVTYNGKAHSISIVGSVNNTYVSVKYEGNGVVDAGEYTVVAKFYFKDIYIEGKDMSATIKVEKASYDTYGIYFDKSTVIYDGKPHSVAVSGNIPEGVTVSYSGNDATEIGEHTVVASFTGDAKNYNDIPNMETKLCIIDGPTALGGVSFKDGSFEYDGKDHALEVDLGTLTGASVTYSDTAKRDAGEYPVTATIAYLGTEYALNATLRIQPRKIDVGANDLSVRYNGRNQSIVLSWGKGDKLGGIRYDAFGNNTAAIGTHEVRFRFSIKDELKGNICYIPDVVATLTILPPQTAPVTDGLRFESNGMGGFLVSGYTGSDTAVYVPEKHTNSLGSTGNVVGIKASAFEGNTSITTVILPDTVKTIGNRAFKGCTMLESIGFGNQLTSIGSLAFANSGLKNVVIPDTVQAIGNAAFRDMTALESITLPFIGGSRTTSNPYIGYIFGAISYAANESYLPITLKRVILSDSCTLVPAYSFFGAKNLEEVVIGSGVKEIGISAFQDCTSLIGLYIPKNVTEIPASAHYYNSIVFGCPSGFTVATDFESAPHGWMSKADMLTEEERAVRVYGVSYEEYLDLVLAPMFEKN
ncbi:MAG: leucine-rich repeat domain-containing protein [Clostridia bacterium]|nr:leucine-rich repeat domain-containing protein [Clostridia bacterium]